MNQSGCQRVFIAGFGAVQPHHVADHPHGVGVHGVDVEQVVLHLADDLAKFGEVAAQHVVFLHCRQGLVEGVWRPQQFHEQGSNGQIRAESVVNQVAVRPQ